MLKVELTTNNNGTFLNLPLIPDELLPSVTIVTPTYNRHEYFEIAIRNYKNFNYPRDKLSWIIYDDSPNDLLRSQIPDDKTIKYIYNNENKCYNNEKKCIGFKRNYLASQCNSDIICHMDDDDYYYPDSVKIRVTAMLNYKKAISGCIEYNCYNIVDDTQFLARGKEELMNIGEASLCYLKTYWDQFKFSDEDTCEESINFFKGNYKNYVDVPCSWVLLSITHNHNTSSRRSTLPLLNHSFLDLLPVKDFEYIKSLKTKLMLNDPDNKEAMGMIKKLQESKNPEKIIDKLNINLRKNVFIREYLNQIPTKRMCTKHDYLILCFPGQYFQCLNFEEEDKLINFIKDNKNKYRFTIYTNCEKGYSYQGITLSPYWKWRTCNKYEKCLVYADPSHLKLQINSNKINFYNKYKYSVPEMSKCNIIDNLEESD